MNIYDVERLHEAGFISAEQKKLIIENYIEKPEREMWMPQRSAVYFLAVIAVAMIVGGAIVLVVNHWQAISPLAKMSAGLLVMLLAWVGHFVLKGRKPLVAEGLALLGAGMWGVNIMLRESLFELDNPAVELFFVFFIGVLPIPFLIRQRVLIGLVMFFSFILLLMMVHAPADCWLALNQLKLYGGTFWSLIMVMLLLWWMVGEKCRGSVGVCMDYYWISFPAYIIFLAGVQYRLLYDVPPMQTIGHNWVIFAVAALFIPLLKPRKIGWWQWVAAALSSLLLLPMAIHLSWHTAYREVIGMLVFAVYGAIFMFLCVRCKRSAWMCISIAVMVCIFFDMLCRIYWSLSDSGLFLIALGAAVLVFAYVLEKQRRYLVSKVKSGQSSPVESIPGKHLPPIPKA